MGVSPKIATDTQRDLTNWSSECDPKECSPAVLLFRGEVYRGLEAWTLTKADLTFAQKHLRILSGLYGVLRPLDLIRPYRLMMGTPWAPNRQSKNLYAYWGDLPAAHLNEASRKNEVIVNLASEEYFKVIRPEVLDRRVVHCEFKETKDNSYKVVSVYAKLARGKMARFIIQERINSPEELSAFNEDGYAFAPSQSSEDHFVFVR